MVAGVQTSNSAAVAQQVASSTQQDSLMSGTLEHSADFAAGHVFSAPLLDKLLSESFYHPHSIDLVKQLIEGDIANERMLTRIPVPERTVGQPWIVLFHELCMLDCVPLGLYRTVVTSPGKTTSYVYTNPLYDTPIAAEDFAFVIGSPKVGLADPPAAAAADDKPRRGIRKVASNASSARESFSTAHRETSQSTAAISLSISAGPPADSTESRTGGATQSQQAPATLRSESEPGPEAQAAAPAPSASEGCGPGQPCTAMSPSD